MLLFLIGIAVIQDLHREKIPNALILFGWSTAIIYTVYEEGLRGILPLLVRITVPIILLFLLYRIRALGAGDIKLFSVIAGFLQLKELAVCIVASFVAGALIGIVKLWMIRKKECAHTIHFSIPILCGYVFVWRCMIEENIIGSL